MARSAARATPSTTVGEGGPSGVSASAGWAIVTQHRSIEPSPQSAQQTDQAGAARRVPRRSTLAKRDILGTNSREAVALGHVIRTERVRRGLTQAAVGRPLSRSFVSSVERGRVVPSLAALNLLCRGLEIRMSELLSIVEADADPKPGP